MLTTFTTEAIRWLHPVETARPVAPAQPEASGASVFSSDQSWIYGITGLVYAGGALASGLLYIWIGAAALSLPIPAVKENE